MLFGRIQTASDNFLYQTIFKSQIDLAKLTIQLALDSTGIFFNGFLSKLLKGLRNIDFLFSLLIEGKLIDLVIISFTEKP